MIDLRSLWSHYRGFFLDPGTLVTLVSGLLLAAALISQPSALIQGASENESYSTFYLLSALIGSAFIWYSAARGIREGDFTADIPVSLATLAAFLIGEYPAAAVVAVLLLAGGMLENLVAARADTALHSLASLLPDRVTIREGGVDRVVSAFELRPGDLVIVRSGERVSVDGEVVSGTALVNQAALTGESVAVEKAAGDIVFAGSLLEVGALEVQSKVVGELTTLGQIRRMVEEARGEKAPIERLLDRYARLYTPLALILGGVLWAVSGDIERAITVLIVFCPCVMVLATPTALVASVGNAALRGTLVKRGATVEALAKVTVVAFDKTGTLTLGRPELAEIVPLARDCPSQDEILRLAASAERLSEHPLGRATVEAALGRGLALMDSTEFEYSPGLGVSAIVDGQRISLGRRSLSANLPSSGEIEEQITSLSARGQSVVAITIGDNLPSALLAYRDSLRPESKEAVLRLRDLGIRSVLLTGDNWAAAEAIARSLGIDEVHAEILPGEKARIVADLKSMGERVAFVGDGVNDGPALARADVGVAMGLSGTDVAIETAEVALLADDLTRLPEIVELSRRAIRVIGQNLIFSLGVLAIAITLTIFGYLSPVTGALLHELSSLPVIANSARLIVARSEKNAEKGRAAADRENALDSATAER